MKKTSFSIGQRLALGLIAILALTMAATAYSIWCLNDLTRSYKQAAADAMAQERAAQDWISLLTISSARNLVSVRFADIEGSTGLFKFYGVGDSPTVRAQIAEKQNEILAAINTPEGKRLVEDIAAKRKVYLQFLDVALGMIKEGKKEEAQKYTQAEVLPKFSPYMDAIYKVRGYARELMVQKEAAMVVTSARAQTLSIALSLLALALAALIGWYLTRGITRPLKQAVSVAEKVASGDLRSRIEVKGGDETGALLSAIAMMQENLKGLIGTVQRDVVAVSSSASQLTVAADELSGSAAAQNDAVSSTAASIEELTVSIGQMSDNAQLAQDVVEATVKVSDAGLEMGNKVSREIGEIDRSVDDFATQMQTLQAQAGEIGTVVKLIKEIADQTNLLALNAAIEAARAGEQGRGFAVVADEVRKLAERTGNATSDIQKTIEAIQGNMGAAGTLLENVKSRVDTGVATIGDLIEPLKTLQSQAERAATGLRELTNATREQRQASEQIARSTEQIAASAEENNAAISQSRDTSRALSSLAERLTGSMARFQM